MWALHTTTKPLQDDFTTALSVYRQQNYTKTVYSDYILITNYCALIIIYS